MIDINYGHLNNFLSSGYKSLFKENQTYFKEVFFLKNSESLTIDQKLQIKKNTYWKPNIKKIKKNISPGLYSESKNLLFKKV